MAARMVEYRVGREERVRLITSLLDAVEYPAIELARRNHARWDIEIFDEIKTHLVTPPQGAMPTTFRSKTPRGVFQEAYGLFAAYNFIRGLIEQAGSLYRVPAVEISFVEAMDFVRWALARIQRSVLAEDELIERLLRDIARCRIDRPRRRRICARAVKVGFGKYPTKRSHRGGHPMRVDQKVRLIKRRFLSRSRG